MLDSKALETEEARTQDEDYCQPSDDEESSDSTLQSDISVPDFVSTDEESETSEVGVRTCITRTAGKKEAKNARPVVSSLSSGDETILLSPLKIPTAGDYDRGAREPSIAPEEKESPCEESTTVVGERVQERRHQ